MSSRPSITARVRLPARRSVSMSRRLFTTRIAVTSRPGGTAASTTAHESVSACT
ncbi:MAG: hypothetical protein R2856_30560 [Caldilineaceae bacterium]